MLTFVHGLGDGAPVIPAPATGPCAGCPLRHRGAGSGYGQRIMPPAPSDHAARDR